MGVEMILKSVNTLSTSNFTWCKDAKSFVADASDFRHLDLFKRIYDDACDIGFLLESHVTKKIIPFAFSHEETNSENEIVSWRFVPVNLELMNAGVVVTIFND